MYAPTSLKIHILICMRKSHACPGIIIGHLPLDAAEKKKKKEKKDHRGKSSDPYLRHEQEFLYKSWKIENNEIKSYTGTCMRHPFLFFEQDRILQCMYTTDTEADQNMIHSMSGPLLLMHFAQLKGLRRPTMFRRVAGVLASDSLRSVDQSFSSTSRADRLFM